MNEKTVWEGGPADSYDYTYGTTNPIDTDADLQKIKDNLNALREKLDDKSEFVFGFDEDSYQASGTDTKGEAMDELNKLMGDLTGYDAVCKGLSVEKMKKRYPIMSEIWICVQLWQQ